MANIELYNLMCFHLISMSKPSGKIEWTNAILKRENTGHILIPPRPLPSPPSPFPLSLPTPPLPSSLRPHSPSRVRRAPPLPSPSLPTLPFAPFPSPTPPLSLALLSPLFPSPCLPSPGRGSGLPLPGVRGFLPRKILWFLNACTCVLVHFDALKVLHKSHHFMPAKCILRSVPCRLTSEIAVGEF